MGTEGTWLPPAFDALGNCQLLNVTSNADCLSRGVTPEPFNPTFLISIPTPGILSLEARSPKLEPKKLKHEN